MIRNWIATVVVICVSSVSFAQKIEEISNNEAFGNLKETGAAKEASERLEKCVDGMDKKAEEITANMLNSITGENAEEAEEPAEE